MKEEERRSGQGEPPQGSALLRWGSRHPHPLLLHSQRWHQRIYLDWNWLGGEGRRGTHKRLVPWHTGAGVRYGAQALSAPCIKRAPEAKGEKQDEGAGDQGKRRALRASAGSVDFILNAGREATEGFSASKELGRA